MKTCARNALNLIIFGLLVVFLAITPLFFACDSGGDDDDDDSSSQTTYFPLAQGHRWDFVVQGSQQNGAGTAEVKATETFNGSATTPIELTETSGQGLGSGTAYIVADSSKVDVLGGIYAADQYTLNKAFTVLQFPLSVGKSWTSDTSITIQGFPATIVANTSVASKETISVQGKSYADCFKLTSTLTVTVTVVIPIQVQLPVTVWLAPDIGPVKAIATIPSLPIFPDLPEGDVTLEVTSTNF